jgi:hypothetical protein
MSNQLTLISTLPAEIELMIQQDVEILIYLLRKFIRLSPKEVRRVSYEVRPPSNEARLLLTEL